MMGSERVGFFDVFELRPLARVRRGLVFPRRDIPLEMLKAIDPNCSKVFEEFSFTYPITSIGQPFSTIRIIGLSKYRTIRLRIQSPSTWIVQTF